MSKKKNATIEDIIAKAREKKPNFNEEKVRKA